MGGQLWVQFVGVVSVVVFTAAVTWGILKLVGLMTGGLRVSEEQEVEGLDHISHEETGYNM